MSFKVIRPLHFFRMQFVEHFRAAFDKMSLTFRRCLRSRVIDWQTNVDRAASTLMRSEASLCAVSTGVNPAGDAGDTSPQYFELGLTPLAVSSQQRIHRVK